MNMRDWAITLMIAVVAFAILMIVAQTEKANAADSEVGCALAGVWITPNGLELR